MLFSQPNTKNHTYRLSTRNLLSQVGAKPVPAVFRGRKWQLLSANNRNFPISANNYKFSDVKKYVPKMAKFYAVASKNK